jgi:phosphomannomutase/phosphoglucomutase
LCTKQQANRVITQLKKEHQNHDTTDGIKIIIDEKNWVMIRPSGTEPIARIYAESDSQQRLDGLMSKYLKKVKAILGR